MGSKSVEVIPFSSLLFELVRNLRLAFELLFLDFLEFKVLSRMSESETSKSVEKDTSIDRATELFGDEVAQKFQGKHKKKLAETLTSFSSPRLKLSPKLLLNGQRLPTCFPRTYVCLRRPLKQA